MSGILLVPKLPWQYKGALDFCSTSTLNLLTVLSNLPRAFSASTSKEDEFIAIIEFYFIALVRIVLENEISLRLWKISFNLSYEMYMLT